MDVISAAKRESQWTRISLSIIWLHSFLMDWLWILLKTLSARRFYSMLLFVTVCTLPCLIWCVAPYGVRAGAKRLGSKKDMKTPILRSDGRLAHTYLPFRVITDNPDQTSWLCVSHCVIWTQRCNRWFNVSCSTTPEARWEISILVTFDWGGAPWRKNTQTSVAETYLKLRARV